MRICRFMVFVLLAVALLTPGLFASGFGNSGIGSQALGLSGAFRAVADDWTAAFYNPAGYAFILDNQLGSNLSLVNQRNEMTPNYVWPGGSDWGQPGVYNGFNLYNFHEVLSNPSAGFITRMPLLGETVIGLSSYQPFDNNITWELYKHAAAYNNVDTLTVPGDQYRNNLDVVAFQLTLAREYIENKLSFGIGLQLLRADILFNDVVFRDNPFWDNLPSQYQTGYMRKITEFTNNNGNGFGFGFNAGILYKSSEKLNLAFTVNVPFKINMTGDAKLEFHMPKIPVYHGDSVQITYPGQSGNLFVTGPKLVDSASFEATLDLPTSFAFGLAYSVSEKLVLSADAEYTVWNSYEGLTFEYSDHRGLPTVADTSTIVGGMIKSDLAYPVDWDNTIKLMGGLKYDLLNMMTFYGGMSFDQSPTRTSEQVTPQFINLGDTYGFSSGFIFHVNNWDLGIISSYAKSDDLTVKNIEDLDGDGNFDSFAGDYKASRYETVLSINYRF